MQQLIVGTHALAPCRCKLRAGAEGVVYITGSRFLKDVSASSRIQDLLFSAQAAAVGRGHRRGLRSVRLQPAGEDVSAQDGVGVARRDLRC